MWLLEKGWLAPFFPEVSPHWGGEVDLRVPLPGIGDLAHPIGLAAGFDKNARCPFAFKQMGFSFLELGTVTPKPQPGNPKPRMFRYKDTMAIINRMGFNSDGLESVASRLRQLEWDHSGVPYGVNLGKNKATPNDEALEDYLAGLKASENLGQYFVINLSSPNTSGLRDLVNTDFLELLASEAGGLLPKIWVKLDPDLAKKDFQKVIEKITSLGFQGVILCNTHRVEWPEAGGQSGHPLASLAATRLEWAHEVHKGELFMIASGGILTGLDVYERVIRGAMAVQIYAALVYRGPYAVHMICDELAGELRLRSESKLSDLVGRFYEE